MASYSKELLELVDESLLKELLASSQKNSANTAVNIFLINEEISPGSNVVSLESLKKLFKVCMGSTTTVKKIKSSCKDRFTIHGDVIYLNITQNSVNRHIPKKQFTTSKHMSNKFQAYLAYLNAHSNLTNCFENYEEYAKRSKLNTPFDEKQYRELCKLFNKEVV